MQPPGTSMPLPGGRCQVGQPAREDWSMPPGTLCPPRHPPRVPGTRPIEPAGSEETGRGFATLKFSQRTGAPRLPHTRGHWPSLLSDLLALPVWKMGSTHHLSGCPGGSRECVRDSWPKAGTADPQQRFLSLVAFLFSTASSKMFAVKDEREGLGQEAGRS